MLNLLALVFILETKEGGWHVELNTDTLPRVLVNQRYYAQISGQTKSETDKAFLSECLKSANWLVKSLDQRARTILKVEMESAREASELFETLMGDEVEPRRKFIEEHARFVRNLDV